VRARTSTPQRPLARYRADPTSGIPASSAPRSRSPNETSPPGMGTASHTHESRSTLVTDVSISSASRHRRLLGVKYGFPPRPALCVLREDEVIPEDRLNTSTGKATFDTWVVSHLSCEPSPHEPCHGASSRAVRASHARGTLPPRAPVCSLCGAGQAAASHQGGVRQGHRLAGHYWCQARDTG